jgi:hypothetical protein
MVVVCQFFLCIYVHDLYVYVYSRVHTIRVVDLGCKSSLCNVVWFNTRSSRHALVGVWILAALPNHTRYYECCGAVIPRLVV